MSFNYYKFIFFYLPVLICSKPAPESSPALSVLGLVSNMHGYASVCWVQFTFKALY